MILKQSLLISLIILLSTFEANASRTLYVDNFETIIGDSTSENS